MKYAYETIKNIIRNRVAFINLSIASGNFPVELYERNRHELMGMLVCLKHINESENFHCINFLDDKVEFGFYDINGKWNVIA